MLVKLTPGQFVVPVLKDNIGKGHIAGTDGGKVTAGPQECIPCVSTRRLIHFPISFNRLCSGLGRVVIQVNHC